MSSIPTVVPSSNESPVEQPICRLVLPVGATAEFDALAARMQLLRGATSAAKSLGVTDFQGQHGTSQIVAGLACALATQRRGQVLIVATDAWEVADRVSAGAGWRDVLRGTHAWTAAVRPTNHAHVHFLASGRDEHSVDSSAWQALVQELKQEFTWVLVDLPAIRGRRTVVPLAAPLDGVALAMGAGELSVDDACRWRLELERAGAHLLGVVLHRPRSTWRDYWRRFVGARRTDQSSDRA